MDAVKLNRKLSKKLLILLLVIIIVAPLCAMEGGGNDELRGETYSCDLRCAICLVDYPNTRNRAGLIFTQCNHGFHINCLHQLLATATKCPCCRREIDVVALVGVAQARRFESARMARIRGNLVLPDVVVGDLVRHRQAGGELLDIYWQLRIAILANNPNIVVPRDALVAALDQNDRNLQFRVENLLDSAILVARLASLPDDVARQELLVRHHNNALHVAVDAGDVEPVASLLATISDDAVRRVVVNSPDSSGRSLLHSAVWGNNLDMVRFLVNAGAHINLADQEGRTTLHEVAGFGHMDIAMAMLVSLHSDDDRQIAVNAVAANGRTPLHEAAFRNSLHVVQLFLRAGADRNLVDEQGNTPADLARNRGYEEIVQMIEGY